MKNKDIFVFVISAACSPFYAMQVKQNDGFVQPTIQQIKYIKTLFRATLDPHVRGFMNLNSEDTNVKFLNRYIEIATDNFWKNQKLNQPLPIRLTHKDLTEFVCQENLCKLFEVQNIFDLQMRVGAMGAVYDFYKPCNTWAHILLVIQEQIKRKFSCRITLANWPLKSLELSTH